ncbi:MAG: M1 family aminopeptidase, partial [Terriglobales bacterium]
VGSRGTWYPNRGFSKAMFDLSFRYPLGWTLVATGERKNEETIATPLPRGNSDQRQEQRSRWISERPIPVAGFNLGKYKKVIKRAGSVTVEVYAASSMERSFPSPIEDEILPPPQVSPGRPQVPILIPTPPPPPSPAANAAAVADSAARAITFFASRYGPYPYTDLAVTQMPGPVSQGWPGLIFLSSFSFLSSNQSASLRFSPIQQMMSAGVIAHETAHQWWGDLVTWSGYRDQWIMEALASYSSLSLLESQNPAEFRVLMQKYRDDLLKENDHGERLMDAGPVTLGVRLNSSKFPDGYETIAYERGTWLLYMLRSMMRDAQEKSGARRSSIAGSSDEPFLQALLALRERYQTKPVSTSELMRIFEEHLPPAARYEGRKSLDWFFAGWVNGNSIPELELHGLKFRDLKNSTIVTGIVQQKDAPESLITSVPLYASLRGRNVPLERVFADGQETTFHVIAPLGTRRILLDPDHTVLSRFH